MSTKNPKHQSAKFHKIEESRSTILTTVTIAAILLSVSLVLTKFIFEWWSYNQRVIDQQTGSIRAAETNIDLIDQLITNYTAFEANGSVDAKTVLDALPAVYDFNALNTSLEFLVQSSGLSVESITADDLSKASPNSSYEPTPIEMEFKVEARGDYDEVTTFISQLNRSIRPIKISNITLNGSNNNMTVTVAGYTYYQPAQNLDFPVVEVTGD